MPGMDGFAVAKRLREFSSTYLIMITALADEIDVVQGFEAGADDYLVKPFRPRELRARADSMLRRPRSRRTSRTAGPTARRRRGSPSPVEACRRGRRDPPRRRRSQLPVQPPPPQPQYHHAGPQPAAPAHPPVSRRRRCQRSSATPPQPVPHAQPAPSRGPSREAGAAARRALPRPGRPAPDGRWMRFNGLALNHETRMVTVNGGAVDLTRTEFDLLASLLSTGRRVRSKADLVLTMRGQQYVTSYFVNEADKRSVEVHIANLRRKLGDDGAAPRYIETVRGVGYRLAEAR